MDALPLRHWLSLTFTAPDQKSQLLSIQRGKKPICPPHHLAKNKHINIPQENQPVWTKGLVMAEESLKVIIFPGPVPSLRIVNPSSISSAGTVLLDTCVTKKTKQQQHSEYGYRQITVQEVSSTKHVCPRGDMNN
jgi:hypothetical protein